MQSFVDGERTRKAAATDFFAHVLQSGTPLQTPIESAFATCQKQLPPAQRVAFESPARADATSIIQEVFEKQDRAAALTSLLDPEVTNRVKTCPNVLTPAECAILRQHCDLSMAESQLGGSRDNTDGLPDFQVNIDRRELEVLLHVSDGADIIDRLCARPDVGWCQMKEWARIGIFVRRYSQSTRPWMAFHTDGNAYTANVALSSSSDHTGGALLCLVGGSVCTCDRELGSATVHRGDVCHAITPVTSGTRYSLLIFFHDKESEHTAATSISQEIPLRQLQQRHPGIQEM